MPPQRDRSERFRCALEELPVSHADLAGMKRASIALAGLLLAAGAQPGSAQNADAGPAAWRVECSGDGKTLDCRAVQQAFQRETRQLVLSVLVRPAPDGKTGAMAIQLPLGLNLTEPVTVRVDSGAPERQPIQTCTNVGCFVAMAISDKLLAAMRSGRELKIAVQDANTLPRPRRGPDTTGSPSNRSLRQSG